MRGRRPRSTSSSSTGDKSEQHRHPVAEQHHLAMAADAERERIG